VIITIAATVWLLAIVVCGVMIGNMLTIISFSLRLYELRARGIAPGNLAATWTRTSTTRSTRSPFKLRPQKEVERLLGLRPWSKKHRRCVRCRKTSRPHQGRGLCRRCWNKQYVRPSRRAS
jgi:hypothetical protein